MEGLVLTMLSQLHGDAKTAASRAGVKTVNVSISHDDDQAVAVAVSTF